MMLSCSALKAKDIAKELGCAESKKMFNLSLPSFAAFIRYFDNPGGNIPKWFLNWAAKVTMLLHGTAIPKKK